MLSIKLNKSDWPLSVRFLLQLQKFCHFVSVRLVSFFRCLIHAPPFEDLLRLPSETKVTRLPAFSWGSLCLQGNLQLASMDHAVTGTLTLYIFQDRGRRMLIQYLYIARKCSPFADDLMPEVTNIWQRHSYIARASPPRTTARAAANPIYIYIYVISATALGGIGQMGNLCLCMYIYIYIKNARLPRSTF